MAAKDIHNGGDNQGNRTQKKEIHALIIEKEDEIHASI